MWFNTRIPVTRSEGAVVLLKVTHGSLAPIYLLFDTKQTFVDYLAHISIKYN